MAMNSVMAKRYELSDEDWDVVSDLFIETRGWGRSRLSDRLMLDGVLWGLCSGTAWRDMPERFGPILSEARHPVALNEAQTQA